MKYFIAGVLVAAAMGFGAWYLLVGSKATVVENQIDTSVVAIEEPVNTFEVTERVEEDEPEEESNEPIVQIGSSVSGTGIMAHRFGEGDTDVLIVGGIHGAYAPNTAALAERVIAYAGDNPDFVPEGVRLHVIPNLNPDGLALGKSPEGRFNANDVDLNRNFDCEWAPEAVWQNKNVSGGATPFSEPEAVALRDYVQEISPAAAVMYYAADGGVYVSSCRNGVSPLALELTNAYAAAAGYSANESFDFYSITGDAVNWMAKEDVPAISVLLSNYTSTEWDKNKAGLEAMMAAVAQ